MARRKPPELTFQQHIADFLVREHRYGVIEQGEITDTEHFIAEDHLWAFLTDTQPETLKKLTEDYVEWGDPALVALFDMQGGTLSRK